MNTVNQKNRKAKTTFHFFVGLLIFIFGVGVGVIINYLQESYSQSYTGQTAQLTNIDRSDSYAYTDVDFSLFWTVWDSVTNRYIEQPVNEVDLFYGAVTGMVAGLGDPHSLFFDPEETADFFEEINGSFDGIGAEIGIKNDQLTIIAPLPGSPAEQAGLHAGDIVLAIDDLDSSFMTVNTAVRYIRGEQGTTVVLTIQREGAEAPFNVDIVRDTIQVDSITWEMIDQGEKRIAMITITHFNSDTALYFQEAMNAVLLEQPDGIILDLRNNAGGFLDAAIDIASTFIESGNAVVYEQYSDGEEKAYNATGSSAPVRMDTVVLINSGSASASEILAGALQDYDIATLIGTTSFGKGTVQDLQTFSDGSSLKLTISRWLTPNKNHIDAVGVEPDYTVERTAEDFSNDLDPQYDAALLFFTDAHTFEQTYNTQTEEESTN